MEFFSAAGLFPAEEFHRELEETLERGRYAIFDYDRMQEAYDAGVRLFDGNAGKLAVFGEESGDRHAGHGQMDPERCRCGDDPSADGDRLSAGLVRFFRQKLPGRGRKRCRFHP